MAEKKIGDKVIKVVVDDITDMEIEAFVFDITGDAKLGSGYGGAIAVRGGPSIQKALDEIGECPAGKAIYTEAGDLKAKHIIYTNGPKFHEPETEAKLEKAINAALDLAEEKEIKQLAFPPVGTGMYQVPLDLCARVMTELATKRLEGDTCLEEVFFVALDTRELKPLQAAIK